MADNTKQWAKSNLLDQKNESNLYFGIEKQHSFQSLMLDLRFKDGNYSAIPYSYIKRIDFNPSSGISIVTTEDKIEVVGRNMMRLYEYLIMHRVTFIKEADSNFDSEKEEDCFIEKITIEADND